MDANIKIKKFQDLDINDPFFSSLKNDYNEFEDWFKRKSKESAYVLFNEQDQIEGFLYLKIESGIVQGVHPEIQADKILKIGTLKINPHGTRLGERFVKIALDYAMDANVNLCYVTLFDKQVTLLQLFEKYGFIKSGVKETQNGDELVLVKNFEEVANELLHNYPKINFDGNRIFLLSIYPKYHSIMFPDSILNNEDPKLLKDISFTNSIHKVYIAKMKDIALLGEGDVLLIYRTADDGKSAWFSSVVTSICIVEDVKYQSEFTNFDDFYREASKYSVFDKSDLKFWYDKGGCYMIKMTYNVAMPKRIIRRDLIEQHNLDPDDYWGILPISPEQFKSITEQGEVNESFIIN